jgi:hypothetical protein
MRLIKNKTKTALNLIAEGKTYLFIASRNTTITRNEKDIEKGKPVSCLGNIRRKIYKKKYKDIRRTVTGSCPIDFAQFHQTGNFGR